MDDKKQFYTYIVTDSNRKFLKPEISYPALLNAKVSSIGSFTDIYGIPQGNRIVFLEQHRTHDEAEKRFNELSEMTRLIRERLIRKNNPNWLSISNPLRSSLPNPKKAVAYA